MPSRKRSSFSHSLRFPTPIGVAGLACAAVAGSAVGGTGAAAQGGDEGGAVYTEQPRIAKVSCLRKCAPRRRVQAGSTLRITGDALSGVTGITFHGGPGRSDDVKTDVRSGSDRRIHAGVPIGATSGRISAVGSGLKSKRSRVIGILPPPPPEPNPTLTPVPGPRELGAPLLETGTSRVKAYIDAKPTVTFSYRVTEGLPESVTVELLRARDGAVVRSWTPDVAENAVQSVRWNGRTGRRPAASGRYSFRLTVAGAGGLTARSAAAQDVGRDAFDLYDHVFPVRGRHDYGGAGAHFGSGRSGHSHQGHDVFARCGTRLVAARGGRVKFSGYHAAAGNYVVIDGAGTAVDYAYMHLEQLSPFPTGARVYTGQAIGTVGESGNARGCHLHFEMWSAPGWYDGGSPFDPYRSLRTWDGWS